jgi:hypothetical protein
LIEGLRDVKRCEFSVNPDGIRLTPAENAPLNNPATSRMNKSLDSQVSHDALIALPELSAGRRALLRQAGVAVAAPWLLPLAHAAAPVGKKKPPTGMILAYRRFAEKADDAQTIRRATLAEHFKALKAADAHIITMVDLVGHHAGRLANLPPRAVVLSVDDGDRSVIEILMKQMYGSAWP